MAVLSSWPDNARVDIPRNFYESTMDVDDSSLLFRTAVPVKGMSVISSTDVYRIFQIALC